MKRRRRALADQGSMLTLMGVQSSATQPKLHITKEVRDEQDNVLELHTVGVPDDDKEESESGWAYWLSHSSTT